MSLLAEHNQNHFDFSVSDLAAGPLHPETGMSTNITGARVSVDVWRNHDPASMPNAWKHCAQLWIGTVVGRHVHGDYDDDGGINVLPDIPQPLGELYASGHPVLFRPHPFVGVS